MTPHDHFLADICTDPANDLMRLVYADFLEESGEGERGEFVRVQIELARDDRAFADCIACEAPEEGYAHASDCPIGILRRREDELRNAVMKNGEQDKWFPGWKGWSLTTDKTQFAIMGRQSGLVFRGFVSEIRCTWADWLANHEKLFWHPEQTVECERCNGTGAVYHWDNPHARNWFCPAKCANGRIKRPFPAETTVPCPSCGGDSHYQTEICYNTECRGTGSVASRCMVQPLEQLIVTDVLSFEIPDFDRVCDDCTKRQAKRRAEGFIETVRFTCDKCRQSNSWTCSRWPGLKIVLPQAAEVGGLSTV